MPYVDSFNAYYDNQLGAFISSNRQRERLMKKKGLHYAEDNPKQREIRKMGEYFRGKYGDRPLDQKAKREWESASRDFAKREQRERVRKGLEAQYGRG